MPIKEILRPGGRPLRRPIFDNIEQAPGDRAVAEATRRAGEFAARYRKLYPRAVACLEDDVASLTVQLRFPREHWKRIRHSNF